MSSYIIMDKDNGNSNVNVKVKKTKASTSKQKTKFSKLTDYLIKHRHSKKDNPDVQPTHTRIGDENANIYGGSYYINDENYEEFLKLYFEEIIQKGGTEYLTEKQLTNDFVTIAIDIDLHYSLDTQERLHDENYIVDF